MRETWRKMRSGSLANVYFQYWFTLSYRRLPATARGTHLHDHSISILIKDYLVKCCLHLNEFLILDSKGRTRTIECVRILFFKRFKNGLWRIFHSDVARLTSHTLVDDQKVQNTEKQNNVDTGRPSLMSNSFYFSTSSLEKIEIDEPTSNAIQQCQCHHRIFERQTKLKIGFLARVVFCVVHYGS